MAAIIESQNVPIGAIGDLCQFAILRLISGRLKFVRQVLLLISRYCGFCSAGFLSSAFFSSP